MLFNDLQDPSVTVLVLLFAKLPNQAFELGGVSLDIVQEVLESGLMHHPIPAFRELAHGHRHP